MLSIAVVWFLYTIKSFLIGFLSFKRSLLFLFYFQTLYTRFFNLQGIRKIVFIFSVLISSKIIKDPKNSKIRKQLQQFGKKIFPKTIYNNKQIQIRSHKGRFDEAAEWVSETESERGSLSEWRSAKAIRKS